MRRGPEIVVRGVLLAVIVTPRLMALRLGLGTGGRWAHPTASDPASTTDNDARRRVPASVSSEPKSLKDLYDAGGLTADEFAAAKASVLRDPAAT